MHDAEAVCLLWTTVVGPTGGHGHVPGRGGGEVDAGLLRRRGHGEAELGAVDEGFVEHRKFLDGGGALAVRLLRNLGLELTVVHGEEAREPRLRREGALTSDRHGRRRERDGLAAAHVLARVADEEDLPHLVADFHHAAQGTALVALNAHSTSSASSSAVRIILPPCR